jgi:hypothetical protein
MIYVFCKYFLVKKKWIKELFSPNLEGLGGKRNGFGTSVIVLDLKNNVSSEYISIADAARYLDTYPKAIWRKVHNKEKYKGRYIITIKDGNR